MSRRFLYTAATAALLLLLSTTPAGAIDFGISVGADFSGEFDWDDIGEVDSDSDADTGYTLGLELTGDLTTAWELGAGAEYLFPRGFDDEAIDSEAEFWTIYAVTRLQLFGDQVPVYLVGRFGYSDLSVDELQDIDDIDLDTSGGEHWAVGAGFGFLENLKAEVLWSNFSGEIESEFDDSDFDYETISLRVIWEF